MIEKDKKELRPYLLEINQSSSLRTDSPIDLRIKYGLIHDVLRLLCLDQKRRLQYIIERNQKLKDRLMGKKLTVNLDSVKSTAAGDLAGMPDSKDARSH